MAKEIRLPRLGETMEEAIIVNCLVKVGQKVKKGDFLFEIETDKATFEMESPYEGFVKAIVAQPGQTLPVGEILLILGDENEKAGTTEKPGKKTPAEKPSKKMPTDYGKLTRAEKMLLSKREKPCFYLNINVDVTELCKKLNKQTEISLDDFLIKAVAVGLAQWPIMTGRLQDDNIVLAESIDIGLYTTAGGKALAAVLKDVDKKNLAQLAQYRKDLMKDVQTENYPEGGCITISNLGGLGIDSFIPIVEPGQCSILGVGKITDTFVLENDTPTVRKFMKMTLAVDHKIANGAEAAQFLSFVGKLLEDPEKLT